MEPICQPPESFPFPCPAGQTALDSLNSVLCLLYQQDGLALLGFRFLCCGFKTAPKQQLGTILGLISLFLSRIRILCLPSSNVWKLSFQIFCLVFKFFKGSMVYLAHIIKLFLEVEFLFVCFFGFSSFRNITQVLFPLGNSHWPLFPAESSSHSVHFHL